VAVVQIIRTIIIAYIQQHLVVYVLLPEDNDFVKAYQSDVIFLIYIEISC
jgi:hypothetical protein